MVRLKVILLVQKVLKIYHYLSLTVKKTDELYIKCRGKKDGSIQ